MNLLNIEENIKVVKDFPTDEDLKNVIDKTHALGGLVIVNHIWWSNATNQSHRTVLTDHPSREKLLELGVDGFEVINSNVFDLPTYQFVLENKDKLVGVSGSDIHSPDVPSYAWTILNAAGFNRSAIMDQLKAKKTSYLFDPTGSPYLPEFSISSRYYKLSMLNDIVQLLYSFRYYDHGTYSFRGSFCQPSITQVYAQMVGWGIFYLILVFLFFEVFRGIAYGLWYLSRNLVARLKSARKRRNTNHIQ
ncbi:hypothetical protein AX774_g1889 [Zancudomyces culisetae]|uniref:Uncharacterized protein n=1 Tax=Zancudomyces culisetae TaxID=1213189 RepID=A0A1R1PUE5_ZANCU|nr:hypothetical protein AX774_g1889 [Zancudomyces culisetae]|eukprot:OMH84581.1 hypothetical protein AX774_g1889 [Zancudomyces culisetae]